MFNLIEPFESLAEFIVYKVLRLPSGIAESLSFFIYNVLEVFLLILIIGFIIGLVRDFITPEKTRKALSGKGIGVGNIIASFFAVITPVDSFTVIPIFIAILEAGIPTGIAFSYLITAPMTNEVAFALFWGLLGPEIAVAYYIIGIMIGVIAGLIIGALKPEKYLEPFILRDGLTMQPAAEGGTFPVRIRRAAANSMKFFKSVWMFIVIGIGIASLIHNFLPASILTKYVGISNPLAVPIAVFIVFFFYINIGVALPIILIFVQNGLPIGTVLAFTMAVTATSVPELLILRRALKFPLLSIYVFILFAAIILAGYLLNTVFQGF